MTSVSKQRLMVLVLTLAMLFGGEVTAPRLAAAVAAVLFFCWFVGHVGSRQPATEPKTR